jgi:hypothetical protein
MQEPGGPATQGEVWVIGVEEASMMLYHATLFLSSHRHHIRANDANLMSNLASMRYHHLTPVEGRRYTC